MSDLTGLEIAPRLHMEKALPQDISVLRSNYVLVVYGLEFEFGKLEIGFILGLRS